MEHGIDWNMVGVLTGIVAALVGAGVVYLRLFVDTVVSGARTEILDAIREDYITKELADARYARRGGGHDA